MSRAIKTVPEMANDMLADVGSSYKKQAVYKVEAERFKKAELASDISRAVNAIANDRTRVDFSSVDDVRQRIVDYLMACSQAGVYPSVQGLATFGFGISRQALNQWRNRATNRGSEVALLIDRACDMFADVLTNQSLHNNANPVQALFMLKNNHGFQDRVEVEPVIDNGIEQTRPRTMEEIRQRYCIPYDIDDTEGETAEP